MHPMQRSSIAVSGRAGFSSRFSEKPATMDALPMYAH